MVIGASPLPKESLAGLWLRCYHDKRQVNAKGGIKGGFVTFILFRTNRIINYKVLPIPRAPFDIKLYIPIHAKQSKGDKFQTTPLLWLTKF